MSEQKTPMPEPEPKPVKEPGQPLTRPEPPVMDGNGDGEGRANGDGDGRGNGEDATGAEPHAQPDRLAMSVDVEQPPKLPFPVVGIGGSAGGIEAFGEFFRVMPVDAGMAFVVILHLPPDRESMLAEVMSKRTGMPV